MYVQRFRARPIFADAKTGTTTHDGLHALVESNFGFGRKLAVARRQLDGRTPPRPPAISYVRSTSIAGVPLPTTVGAVSASSRRSQKIAEPRVSSGAEVKQTVRKLLAPTALHTRAATEGGFDFFRVRQ